LYRDEEAIKLREMRKKKAEERKIKDDDKGKVKDENKMEDNEDDDWETDSADYEMENPEMVQLEDLLQGLNLEDKDEEDLDREVEDL